ncbi:hypothetical protein PpBr36_03964 [Pyricularia pennisetigena]|uniref:hypothetical protein n=1 Tax=Pyricularia pennisetigena TaxID=1578925 RepID=UPI00114D8A25|nr:hypothetical protein PpBr36_03964 [Pyricularia pennisetigena]TLS29880.1 hypothetical protein PpBr36_03964 [Pyricularia pennisetigena]
MTFAPQVNISQAGVPQGFATENVRVYASYVITALLFGFLVLKRRGKYPDVPWVNPKRPTEFTTMRQRREFLMKGQQILHEGAEKFKDKPSQLMTELGPVLLLPPKYVEELKNNKALNFRKPAEDTIHSKLWGFTPMDAPAEIHKVVNNHLTKALLSLTKPISEETTQALREVFRESKEWFEITPETIMLVVTRMSSKVFMGKELCGDKEWIATSSAYVAQVFYQRFVISEFPKFLRPLANVFLPGSIEVRRTLKPCQKALQPHMERREIRKKEALARGETNPCNDSIEWFAQEIKSRAYDPASLQIALSVVAIHATADLLAQTLFDLAKSPHLIEPLRNEVIEVIGTYGYFLRTAEEDIKLSDGFLLKKGTKTLLSMSNVMQNGEIYQDPFRYNPYRFVEMRKNSTLEGRAHLVSATPEHFGFGHGAHACPGRFFAANELKIAMAHILLKYDLKLADGVADLEPLAIGINLILNPGVKLLFRRRKEELDLDTIEI